VSSNSTPSPSLTGTRRPIHTAAENGDLDEITRLLGEPVDPRNEVSLPLSSLSHLYDRLGGPLSSWPVSMVNPMPPLFSSRGELISISRTRSPHSLSSLSHLFYSMGTPLSSMPVAMVTPQLSLFSSRGERLLIFGPRSPHSLFLFDSLSPQVNNKTALDHAREYKKTDCISLLERHMVSSLVPCSFPPPSLTSLCLSLLS
jgi:hypothetical protein